ncbi:SRS domain-containing protein [Neospora caninum Liverpool]|uniref:SRS domain-containing protein n=1 Tax=Neospora caninum (strain Liverpool) TaxID=572307 RepID=F0VLA6_NEOCL|nr:SRS domain-containing protein [Neospora caninum Liverpool]CBZ54858.1 SRS domain-containing protein [Neospora caninum Liverpool]CEL69578.1 TPA: SRS domain-containing protein [Neospora caninum Liverpool]|eukprot:XP_003884886.1 SRS domain-containing protein [Neospora caninum Liverpool]
MMPVCAFGGSQVWRGLRCAFGVSIVVGFVFLSCRGETSAKEPVTCPPTTNFLPVWTVEGIPFFFKCPEGSSLFPTASDGKFKTFCRNSSCTNQAELDTVYTTLQEAAAGDERVVPAPAGAQTKVYELEVHTEPEFPTTLYFLCKSTQDRATESLATTEARSTSDTMESTCTFQVAVFSRKPLSDAASEKVCEFGNTMKITLNPKSNKVTFRCGDTGVVWPLNFENAFKGEACTEEVSLASLGLGAFRVEGESSDETAKAPAYTLEVSEFPTGTGPVQLCYKYTKPPEQEIEQKSESDVCKVLINVAPKSETEDGKPGDDRPPTSGDQPSTGDTIGLATHSLIIACGTFLSCAVAIKHAL